MNSTARPWGTLAATVVIAAGVGGLAGRLAPPVAPAEASDLLWVGPSLSDQGPEQATRTLKVGFINSQAVFDLHPQVPQIRQAFQNQLTTWQKEQVDLEGTVQTLQNELRTAQLSPQQRRRKEQELAQALTDLNEYQSAMWSQGGRAELKEQEMMQPVIQAMDAVIRDLAEGESYDLIWDASGGGILFGNKELDLTRTVLEKLGITPPPEVPPGSGR